MQLIAHSVNEIEDAKKALDYGCSLLELDLSQNILTGNFTIQHDAVKGKFGIGKNPLDVLKSKFKEKLVIDLKAAKYSLSFGKKFKQLLGPIKIKNLRLTSIDLKVSSRIAEENNARVYYGFLNKKSIDYFWKISSLLYRPAGFSIRKELIDDSLIKSLKSKYPKSQIWAWTVNDKSEIKRLKTLGVDAVVTDLWKA